MKLLNWAISFCLWLLAGSVIAQDASVLPVTTAQDSFDLRSVTTLLEDPGGKLTLADVLQPENQARFQATDLKLGFNTSPLWLRIRLASAEAQSTTWWLDTGGHTIPEIDFFGPDEKGTYQKLSSGSSKPFSERALPVANFVFPLLLPASQTVDVYCACNRTAG